MAMAPLFGEAWFAKKGSDFVHSFVYCAADFVAPRAERRGDVVALYAAGGDAEEYLLVVGGDFVLLRS